MGEPKKHDGRSKKNKWWEKHKKTSRYYMKGGLGCALHTHNAKENWVTWHSGVYSNELSEQVEKVFQDIGCHNVFFSIAQDMIHERRGNYISYNRLYYLIKGDGKDAGR